MAQEATPRCASCQTRDCAGGKDCFATADRHRVFYEDPQIARLHKAATAVEGRHYCKEPRIREIMLLARELGYRKLGLAFCVGLAAEAGIVAGILSQEFEVVSVCCKLSGLAKRALELERFTPPRTTRPRAIRPARR